MYVIFSWSLGVLLSGIIGDVYACNRPLTANKDVFSDVSISKNVIRVMSYNIRGESKVDRERGNSWDVRKHNIQRLIEYYQPDIIGLQEVSRSYMPDLEKLFPGYVVIAFDISDIDKDAALLVRASRFEVQDRQFFWLSEDPYGNKLPAWDARSPRIVVYTRLLDKQIHKEFFVFCTHFDSTGTKARFESAELLVRESKRIVAQLPVVVVGDFNLIREKQAEEIYQIFVREHSLIDVRDCSTGGHSGPDGSWIGWSYDAAAVAQGAVGARLDHIFVQGADVLQEGVIASKVAAQNKIVKEQDLGYLDTPYPSDHLPIIADVVLK